MPPIRPTVYHFNISLHWSGAGGGRFDPPARFRAQISGEHELWLGDDQEPYDVRIYESIFADYPYKLLTRYAPVFVRPLLVKLAKTKLRDCGFRPADFEVGVEMQKIVAMEQFGHV